MKHTLLIITALLFITSTVIPQSKVNVNSLKEYGGKAFKVDDDEPYTGRVFDLNKNTGKKTLKGQYKNGLKTGKWTSWYWNGQKKYERTYKDGKRDGKWTEWREDGQKKYETTYKDGKLDGKYTAWNYIWNGQKWYEETYKDGKRDGRRTEWREDGQKKSEGTYKNGLETGKWTYWSGGENYGDTPYPGSRTRSYHKSSEITSKDGEVISAECWDEDGNECECHEDWWDGCK